MAIAKKKDFPVGEIRRFLEPGPVVLVSSAYRGKTNIMTMGWHMVLEFTPSLVGCLISSGNHSHDMISRSRECVINVPTADLQGSGVDVHANVQLHFRVRLHHLLHKAPEAFHQTTCRHGHSSESTVDSSTAISESA